MFDFLLFGFPFFVVLFLLFSLDNKGKASSAAKKHDAVLIVSGDTLVSNKSSAGTFEYRYDDLNSLAISNTGKRPKDDEYFGPGLSQVLNHAGLTSYSSILFFSAGSKKVQKLMAKDDVGGWIIAIEKDEKPLSWESDGPYLLYKKSEKDKTKYVPRLLRIETKVNVSGAAQFRRP